MPDRRPAKEKRGERQPRAIPLEGTPFKLVEAIDRDNQSYWFIFSDYALAAQIGQPGDKKLKKENLKITAFVDPEDGEGYTLGDSNEILLPLGHKVEPNTLEKIKSLAKENNIQLTPLFSVYSKVFNLQGRMESNHH